MRQKRVMIVVGSPADLVMMAEELREKWSKKPGRDAKDFTIIHLDPKHPTRVLTSLLGSIDNSLNEIAIFGHGSSSDNSVLYENAKSKIALTDIAKVVGGLIERSEVGARDNPVRISLLACLGGYKSSRDQPSIAENLHQSLYNEGIHANIVCRPSIVSIQKKTGRKSTVSMADRDRILASSAERPRNLFSRALARVEDKFFMRTLKKDIHAPKLMISPGGEGEAYSSQQADVVAREKTPAQYERMERALDRLTIAFDGRTEATEYTHQIFTEICNEVINRRCDSYGEVNEVIADKVEQIGHRLSEDMGEMMENKSLFIASKLPIFPSFARDIKLAMRDIASFDEPTAETAVEESKSALLSRT
ncbi:MAG: hypothetical protein P1U63_13420 [Coxiellaceae bacterium]|nr:hypothetical protein [Coxiellaceae bacterium]